ncbi:MAG: PorT family protein [Bacteroidetes bacterium]|nr:PorT family protein [Bacteroidota bacterium]
MQDKRANIDIVFRNGLRNLEVLPPPGLWHDIAPVAISRARFRIYIGTAASVAVIAVVASALWLASGLVPVSLLPGTFTLNQDMRPAWLLTATNNTLPVLTDDTGTQESVPAYPVSDRLTTYDTRTASIGGYVPADDEEWTGDNGTMVKPGSDIWDEGDFLTPEIPASFFESSADHGTLSTVKQGMARRWQMGMGLSPSYIIKKAGGDPVMANMLDSERSFISYTGGITVSFSFTNRLSLSTGLQYSSVGQAIEDLAAYTGFSPHIDSKGSGNISVTTSAGTILSDNPDLYIADHAGGRVTTAYSRDVFDPVKANLPYASGEIVQSFGYLEMPIMLRYKLIDRMVDLSLTGGVSYGLLIANSVHATTISGEKIEVGRTGGVNPFSISSQIGVGLAYNLTGSVLFNIEPLMRYNISALGTEGTSVPNPWSVGLFTGFSIRF